MKLAVLMSTYNGAEYIREQIDSILAQVCDFQIDIWARDDGSQDETCQILQEYADAGKLRWYTGENLKPAKSFLDLISHCPGYDYYAFADQDDYWEPDKLAVGVSLIQDAAGPAFSFSNALLVDQNLNSLGRNVYHRKTPEWDLYTMSCAGGILGCTMVFNRALAELIQNAPVPKHVVMHDFYLALVCALAGGSIFYNAAPSMKYRQHGHNVVGVSRNTRSALMDRFRTITHRAPISVSQQAQSLLDCYPNTGTSAHRKWLKTLANPHLFSRLRIACSTKPHFISKNRSLTLRLAIFLRNR